MILKYKLTQHLLGRNAAQLVNALGQLRMSISIYRKEETSCINAKSLVGVLSGCYKMGDIITIHIDDVEDLSRLKEIFNEYGMEINPV